MDKHQLRREAIVQRDALSERERRSAAICAAVLAMPLYAAVQAIHCYLPMRSEVDTRPLIAATLANGKPVAVPVLVRGSTSLDHVWIESLDDEALERGVFGTLSPRSGQRAHPGDWPLTIVPLLAFDRRGYRLGYGKGYYDRLLSTSPTATIGVAFAAQEIPVVPHEPHDIPLDYIVTEYEIIRVGQVQI